MPYVHATENAAPLRVREVLEVWIEDQDEFMPDNFSHMVRLSLENPGQIESLRALVVPTYDWNSYVYKVYPAKEGDYTAAEVAIEEVRPDAIIAVVRTWSVEGWGKTKVRLQYLFGPLPDQANLYHRVSSEMHFRVDEEVPTSSAYFKNVCIDPQPFEPFFDPRGVVKVSLEKWLKYNDGQPQAETFVDVKLNDQAPVQKLIDQLESQGMRRWVRKDGFWIGKGYLTREELKDLVLDPLVVELDGAYFFSP